MVNCKMFSWSYTWLVFLDHFEDVIYDPDRTQYSRVYSRVCIYYNVYYTKFLIRRRCYITLTFEQCQQIGQITKHIQYLYSALHVTNPKSINEKQNLGV